MNTKQKATRVGVVFIALLIIGGLVLMYKGNDALALATEKKEGILTAEQVKMSFDSVSGRLLNEAVKEGDLSHIEEEIGDMIFAVINIARKLKVDPEEALNRTIKKFDKRFRYIEKNTDIKNADLQKMEKLWQEAKNEA